MARTPYSADPSARLLTGLLAALVLLVSLPVATSADEVAGNPQAPFHNLQTFEKDGESIRALRIPVYITIRNWEGRTLGLRLRLAVSFAAADLFSLVKEDLTDINVMSFVPGMEFVFPFGSYHLLRPYADVGTGVDNATEEMVLLGALGLRSDFIFPTGKFIFGLEPGVQYSFNSSGKLRDQSLIRPFATLTARWILGFRIGGYRPDAGVYFETGYDFQTLELTSVESIASGFGTNLEAGLGTGFSMGRPKIGPIPIPRLRFGFRFGDLQGFRIRIGGDWLKTLPELGD